MEYAAKEHECFVVLFLTNQHQLISAVEMFTGTIDGASVYPREILKAALQLNAAAVILSHNHPSGITKASQADKNITVKVKDALNMVDIRTLDHIIVGGVDSFSFAEGVLL
jgi:DNA repair protein RadC